MKVITQDDEYESELIETTIKDVSCKHVFFRDGVFVKCKLCNAMWRDPEGTFPLED